ncbi:TPA: hypothetical protein ACF3XN_004309 [Vibrio parahaemolyticus]|nr:hypothetical protein [Vibrio parahaemolyticus]
MQAIFDEAFNEGFILDESSIRKLRDIILKRAPDADVTLQVEKSDGVRYQTSDFEEAFESENSSWATTKVMSLSFDTKNFSDNKDAKRIDDLRIEFTKIHDKYSYRSPVEIKIRGSDKDGISLLGDDIVKYLKASVIKPSYNFVKLSFFFLLFIASISLWASLVPGYEIPFFESSTKTQITDTSTDSEKIDYLIEIVENISGSKKVPFVYVILTLTVAFPLSYFFISGDASKYYYKYFPNYIFVFGVEAKHFKSSQALKRNIFWSVLVASIVAIVTGLLVWYITSK